MIVCAFTVVVLQVGDWLCPRCKALRSEVASPVSPRLHLLKMQHSQQHSPTSPSTRRGECRQIADAGEVRAEYIQGNQYVRRDERPSIRWDKVEYDAESDDEQW